MLDTEDYKLLAKGLMDKITHTDYSARVLNDYVNSDKFAKGKIYKRLEACYNSHYEQELGFEHAINALGIKCMIDLDRDHFTLDGHEFSIRGLIEEWREEVKMEVEKAWHRRA